MCVFVCVCVYVCMSVLQVDVKPIYCRNYICVHIETRAAKIHVCMNNCRHCSMHARRVVGGVTL